MKHMLDLPERPFRAIQKGTKKVEGRAGGTYSGYETMKPGDELIFTHEDTGEQLMTTILFVHHYADVQSMLKNEGVDNVLSSFPKTIEQGVKSFNSLRGYKRLVTKYGIYAIGIKVK